MDEHDPDLEHVDDAEPTAADVEALAMTLLGDLVTAGPGLVRLATGIGWRMSTWAWRSSLSATQRVVRAAIEGETVGALTAEAIDAARFQARELLGLEMDRRPDPPARKAVEARIDSGEHLRRRGQRLLAASADVHYEEPTHPAYDRILDELAPDEARILRLLCHEGPQPSVDVRTAGTPVAQLGSSMVAPGLSMIGAHAGVRYGDRVPAYLNNLFRLGLVWFSREPVEDLTRYQVLEAQPGRRRGDCTRRGVAAPSAAASTSRPSARTSAASACATGTGRMASHQVGGDVPGSPDGACRAAQPGHRIADQGDVQPLNSGDSNVRAAPVVHEAVGVALGERHTLVGQTHPAVRDELALDLERDDGSLADLLR